LPIDPEFLTEQDILLIHTEQIAEFGGAQGVRDPGLLASALAQPSATFGGTFLHRDLHEMAAAYLYHIAMDHAFVDGNKRTALIACLTFLDLNGVRADRPEPALFDLTMAVADGRVGKDAIAERLRSFFPPPGAERTP
jgi:death on curing protein